MDPLQTVYPTQSVRVKKGAQALDAITPGWADRINLETFDISDSEFCILGQLDIWDDTEWDFDTYTGMGFISPYNHPQSILLDYFFLTDAWLSEIRARRVTEVC